MKKYIYLFPGQGAQYVGMGKDFADHFQIAKETFQEADDLLRMHLSKIVFEGPQDELTLTKHSQLAIFINSMAILRTLQTQLPELQPAICAGLSLGEYSALAASQKLSFQETLLLVKKRSMLMHEACEKIPGTMAAVLGLTEAEMTPILADIDGVWIANFNCPGQIVISGTKLGLEEASSQLKAKGAKRVMPLNVAGAFHSGLMQEAQDLLEPHLRKAPLRHTEILLGMNQPGKLVEEVEDIRKYLIAQVTGSVRWSDTIMEIEQQRPDLYLEIGCGKTLTGFNKKIGVNGFTLSVERIHDLDTVAKHIEEVRQC